MCDSALFSGENMLICAPTGAGKTNVAMLCMLHQVRRAATRNLYRVVLICIGWFSLAAREPIATKIAKILITDCDVSNADSLVSTSLGPQIGLNRREDGSLDLSAFKIVYVAPMKALVAEMVGNFSKRLAPFGMQVKNQPANAMGFPIVMITIAMR